MVRFQFNETKAVEALVDVRSAPNSGARFRDRGFGPKATSPQHLGATLRLALGRDCPSDAQCIVAALHCASCSMGDKFLRPPVQMIEVGRAGGHPQRRRHHSEYQGRRFTKFRLCRVTQTVRREVQDRAKFEALQRLSACARAVLQSTRRAPRHTLFGKSHLEIRRPSKRSWSPACLGARPKSQGRLQELPGE